MPNLEALTSLLRADDPSWRALASAERREQVIRALRLARKAAEPRGRGARGSSQPALTGDRLLEDYEGEEYQDAFECEYDCCQPYRGDEWRHWARDADLRVKGVLPVNAMQEELFTAIADRSPSLVPPADFTRGEREAPASVFTCRPISKLAALDRGELGRDCSTKSVPLRALSPHHVYYGIFEGDEQRPGYMTVYEAWAELDGEKRPALCLETINVPVDRFDPIQQDLLLIFDAIARRRGLGSTIVLITGIGTWNYQNGCLLEASRRFRRGRKVKLSPADPVSWRLYARSHYEAHYYSAFTDEGRGDHRILAPFDPDLDQVQPEDLEEARRIAALPERSPIITARGPEGPMGFISALPEVL